MTMLYRSTDRRCRRGAPMVNLSHSASFHSAVKSAPSNSGIKHLDSLQSGDEADYDGMLELFPQNFHEPFFGSYAREDFGAMARACGLTPARTARAYVSKVMVFDKPSVHSTTLSAP